MQLSDLPTLTLPLKLRLLSALLDCQGLSLFVCAAFGGGVLSCVVSKTWDLLCQPSVSEGLALEAYGAMDVWRLKRGGLWAGGGLFSLSPSPGSSNPLRTPRKFCADSVDVAFSLSFAVVSRGSIGAVVSDAAVLLDFFALLSLLFGDAKIFAISESARSEALVGL